MFSRLLKGDLAERGSAALVCLVGAVVGAYAAYGLKHGEALALSPAQWAGAIMSLTGSVLVAVMVHTRGPAPETPQALIHAYVP